MAQNTKIEWCSHTGNLWHGCTEVHAGCDNCYARVQNHHWHPKNGHWGNDVPRLFIKSFFPEIEKYQKLAEDAGKKHTVFVGSMMDIFEKSMPLVNHKGEDLPFSSTGKLRTAFFHNISLGLYPNLIFLLLTKRPSNINKMIPEEWKTNPPENVMFGTSPVDQKTAETLIPQLLQVNGQRFLSCEPQLGEIDLTKICEGEGPTDYKHNVLGGEMTNDISFGMKEVIRTGPVIHWVIQGGESGHHKRPFNLQWAYDMKKQCAIYGVPYFFKQIDKVQQIPENLMIKQFPANHGQA